MKHVLRAGLIAGLTILNSFTAHADSNGHYWEKHRKDEPIPRQMGHAFKHPIYTGHDLVGVMRHYLGDGWRRGFPREWCGAQLALAARQAHIRIPRNPNLAINWRNAGPHLRRPMVGSIGVMLHHVGVVAAVRRRVVVMISGNSTHRRVALGRYPIRAFVAFVAPESG